MILNETLGLKKDELDLIRKLISCCQNVSKAIVYGSRVKGTYSQYSDVDITLVGSDLSQDDIFGIADSLEESNLPYLFDLSDFKTLRNPELIDHIRRCGIEIFVRKE